MQEFCHKVTTFFCLDKMGFTKGLRQKFLKYSIACIYILPFGMKTTYMVWGSILPIEVISVDCNGNLHHLITYKFPHFTFLW